MVLGGVVAGGEVDGAIDFGALDFVCDGRSRSESFAEERLNLVLLEDIDRELREFLGVKARVVADEDGGVFLCVVDVTGDAGDGEVDGDGVMAEYSSAETRRKNSWGMAVAREARSNEPMR